MGENFGRTSPALYDVDNDGQKEIIFGSCFNSVSIDDLFYALKADGTGNNAPGFPRNLGKKASFICSPTVADLDGMSGPDLATANLNGKATLRSTGE